jgi:hypothetical protein
MAQSFSPMEAELPCLEDEVKKISRQVLQTIGSLDNFPGNNLKERQQQRDEFVKHHHPEYGNTREEICDAIAREHLTKRYCKWCNTYIHIIIEHQHIKGTAGKYRGAMCKSCNGIEGKFKNKPTEYKIKHLYEKLGARVLNDKTWSNKCVLDCYVGAVDDDGDIMMI